MEALYKVRNGKLIYLNDLLEEQEKEIDLSIFQKFKDNFGNKLLEKEALGLCDINKIFFLFPYSLAYGYPKTNIVKYFQVAKTGNEKYCKLIFDFVKEKVLNFAKNYDAVVFVPASVDRKCNVLDYLKKYLQQNNIEIIKSFKIREGNEIKNIKSLKEKFNVASKKFETENPQKNYKKILIIDDMVNTGASMCAIANKLSKNAKQIDGLAIVGSLSNELVSDI